MCVRGGEREREGERLREILSVRLCERESQRECVRGGGRERET